MSSLTQQQTNTLINVTLGLMIVAFSLLAYLTYQSWQQSTPPIYTKSASAESSILAVQLQDHIPSKAYTELSDTLSDDLGQDINYATIREGSYKRDDNSMNFLADISGTSATYRFRIDTKTNHAFAECPAVNEQRDESWSCNITYTGDDHDH